MSTAETPPGSISPPGTGPGKAQEIKLISHSNLFYWWPVWALAFVMAFWTWFEDHRLAIVPSGGQVTKVADGKEGYLLKFPETKTPSNSLTRAADLTEYNQKNNLNQPVFPARMSQQAALGAVFVIGLILTIVITNVPLRGLWSFVVLILIVLVVLIISLIPSGWDNVFDALAGLHIYINLAGYLFIGTAVFILWALATWIFDRRSYIIFTPGQVKVCEHIGASVEAFGTMGVRLEKQRDDMFRHYILGFGSGDLIVHTPGGREIKLPNVLGIGWQLKPVEDMMRTMATAG